MDTNRITRNGRYWIVDNGDGHRTKQAAIYELGFWVGEAWGLINTLADLGHGSGEIALALHEHSYTVDHITGLGDCRRDIADALDALSAPATR